MPVYHKGDMWSVFDTVNHFILTPNSQLRVEACKKFNGLDRAIDTFLAVCDPYNGFKCSNKIGIFQTTIKGWKEDHLGVVSANCKALTELAEANPDKMYALVRPGPMYPEWLCKGALDLLPNNVQVWTHETI